ncbi:MAG: hypothetical protein WBC55_09855 [Dehalococcoidia bacterium]
MTQDVDLKQIERKAWSSYFHDGLTDLYGGFILLGLGLAMLTDQSWWLALMLLSMLALWARKRVTYPRMGYVKFAPQREARTKRSRIIASMVLTSTMLLGVIVFALVSTNSLPQWLEAWLADYFLVAFAVMVGAIIAVGAFMVGVARFYAYAVLVLIAFAAGQWLNTSAGLPVTIAAGVILLSGLAVLIRFLRKYPRPAGEEFDDNR